MISNMATAYAVVLLSLAPCVDAAYRVIEDAGSVTANFKSISCVAGGVQCFVAGDVTQLLYTENNGRAWQVQGVPTGLTANLAGVSVAQDGKAASKGCVLAVGDGGMVLKTKNFGATTWMQVLTGVSNNFKAVYAYSCDKAWVVGDSGVILFTTNAGEAWTTQAGPSGDAWLSISCYSETVCGVVGENGKISITSDAGTTWTPKAAAAAFSGTLTGITFGSASLFIISGSGGTVQRTTNLGTTMTAITSGTTKNLYGISMAQMDRTDTARSAVTAVGQSGVMIHSSDAGLTFTVHTDVTTDGLNDAEQIGGVATTVTAGDIATLFRVGFDSCGGCSGQGICRNGACVCDPKISPYASSAGKCSRCPPGTYDFELGFFQNLMFTCFPCASGTYSDTYGSAACTKCDADTNCPYAARTPAITSVMNTMQENPNLVTSSRGRAESYDNNEALQARNGLATVTLIVMSLIGCMFTLANMGNLCGNSLGRRFNKIWWMFSGMDMMRREMNSGFFQTEPKNLKSEVAPSDDDDDLEPTLREQLISVPRSACGGLCFMFMIVLLFFIFVWYGIIYLYGSYVLQFNTIPREGDPLSPAKYHLTLQVYNYLGVCCESTTTTPTSAFVADQTITPKCSSITEGDVTTGCQMEYICDGCVLHDDTMVSFDMAPSIARHMDLPFASAARFNLTVKDTAGEVSNTVGAVMVPDSGALLKGSQTIQIDMYHSSFIDSSVVPWVGSQYTFIPVYRSQQLTSVKPTEAMVKSSGFSTESLSTSLQFKFMMNIATTRYEERKIIVTDLIVVMANLVGSCLGVYIIFTMFHLKIRRFMIRRTAVLRERAESRLGAGFEKALKAIPAWKKALMKNRPTAVSIKDLSSGRLSSEPSSPIDVKGTASFNKVVIREKRMHQSRTSPSGSTQ